MLESGAERDGAGDDGDWSVGAVATNRAEHVAQLYETDAFLIDAVAAFLGESLAAGGAAVAFLTPPHRAMLEERLRCRGIDVDGALTNGRYLPFDAAETIARLAVGTDAEAACFADLIGSVVAHAARERPTRVFGELVALLAADSAHAAAIRLEARWNDLQRDIPFALLCSYPLACLNGGAPASLLGQVCDAHSRVVPAESYSALPTADDRLRAVAGLQQKALLLEAEIAARTRIDERLRLALAAERAARLEAEAAVRARDAFLTVAAHELRTPLTTLLGQAQLLHRRLGRDGRLEPERDGRALRAVVAQAGKLARLVNRLLDVSRLDAGSLTLERGAADLTEIVARVVAEAQAGSDHHRIDLTVPTSLPAVVDSARLEQMLAHLLDNATRFSPDGGAIDVALSRLEPGMAELTVRDRGIGIPPEQRDRVFDRFAQIDADGAHRGLGLGLYISRQIVALHGGEMRVEFPPSGGTRVVARLPLGLIEANSAKIDPGAALPTDSLP